MAQTAKEYAQEQLGKLDTSYLDKEREVAQKSYDTTKGSLETNFNNLLEQIGTNRADTRKNFNLGRSTVAENAYNANRVNQADLASRGVGSSGLKGLGEVGNRIETGRQYSNLANEFYSNMNDLEATEKRGRSQYDIDLANAENTLNKTLADIGSREAEIGNNYNMTLGQLAESVQGRWDSNANAQAALEQAKIAASQAHTDAINTAKKNLELSNKESLYNIVNSNTGNVGNMISGITTRFNVDTNTAINLLRQLGLYNETSNTGYDRNYDYYKQIVGGGY